MQLKSLITPNDDPASGKCCVTIGTIQQVKIKHLNFHRDFLILVGDCR